MKKFNLFVMSLLATASFTLNSCSTDDAMSSTSQQQSVDGFYMTLQVKGSANGANTRTAQPTDEDKKENGTTEESLVTKGTIYIYDGSSCVFKKTITESDWKTQPNQTADENTEGETKPIKVSVNNVKENKAYNVYFLANYTEVADPLSSSALFNSQTGGADKAGSKAVVMFNENDEKKQGTHSTVTFTATAKSESTPATASTIYLDRVVARIDAPTVATSVTTITKEEGSTDQTKNIESLLKGITYESYAVSNLSNNSYVMQNWTVNESKWSLNIPSTMTYFKGYDTYGNEYKAEGLDNFMDNTKQPKTYCFENTTNNVTNATALYFRIKANLKENTAADFTDGTFYRYDNRMYTKIADILNDTGVAYPFVDESGNKIAPADVVKKIAKTGSGEGKTEVIDEDETLAKFRKDYNIEVYREGNMYYRYAINDNYYIRNGYYSVLRNSIYRLTVDAIYDLGKDVPNGEDKNNKKPNFYMSVKVAINPWVLNAKTIQLK